MSDEIPKKNKKGRENLSLIKNEKLIKKEKMLKNEPSWKKTQSKIGEQMEKKGLTTKDLYNSLKKIREEMNDEND